MKNRRASSVAGTTHSELLAMNGGTRFRPSEALTNLGPTPEAEHVGLQIDHPDPMAALRSRGIDARLAWHGDHDQDALVPVTPDAARGLAGVVEMT
jgi:hypothetical protein